MSERIEVIFLNQIVKKRRKTQKSASSLEDISYIIVLLVAVLMVFLHIMSQFLSLQGEHLYLSKTGNQYQG